MFCYHNFCLTCCYTYRLEDLLFLQKLEKERKYQKRP